MGGLEWYELLGGIAAGLAVLGGVGKACIWGWQCVTSRRARKAEPPPAAPPPKVTALPRVPPRNPDFTGREEELTALRESLLEGGTAALMQAITGLGGVGKTQLATEYAYRHREDYDHILWVQSEEPAQLADDFAGLAKLLDLPEQDEQDQGVVTQAVCQWLARNGRWLLVFDNVPHPDSLKGYRPEEGHGHVIITSRDPHWTGVAKPLRVEVWPPDESLAFLDLRLGRTDEAAAELAKELGHLPLALAQAAAYIKNSGTSLEDYLKLYRERREELWKDEKPPREYPETVGTTWSIAFAAARKEEPAAAKLLNLCAFLAPDDIPRDLLAKVIDDPLALNRAITALGHYSLITADEDALSLHRLVQAVTRDRLSDEEQKQWAGAAVRLLDTMFPFHPDDPATWEESGRLLSHALAVARHAADAEVGIASAARLFNDAGLYLRVRADFVGAKAAHEQALAIDERVLGPDHPNVAIRVNNLAQILQDLGDLKGARAHFERALTIWEKAYDPEDPWIAIAANNLGRVLQEMGDLEGAKAHFERALAIFEQAHGKEHPQVAGAANNLGLVLQDMGDLKGAEKHLERALVLLEGAYGKEHPQVATAVGNLGLMFRNMGDLEGAKAYLERALAIDESTYGPDHPDVANAVDNLGGVLGAMGDVSGARECRARALTILEQAYGKEHPRVAIAANNLGSVCIDLGDVTTARKHYQRALAILVKFLGEEHPNTQLVQQNLEALGKE